MKIKRKFLLSLFFIFLFSILIVYAQTQPKIKMNSIQSYVVNSQPVLRLGGDDIWVNESGDSMTGNLNMQDNQILIGDATLYDNGTCFFIDYDGTGSVRIGTSC